MSKQQAITEPDLPPPSYLETISSPSSTTPNSIPGHLPTSLINPYTTPLTTHLQTLPARMRAAQQARSTEQASRDLDQITQMIPHVEAFLSDLGSIPGAPPVAQLTLVPGSAVARGWVLSGAAERRREGEVVRVVRVGGGKSASGNETVDFSDERKGRAGGRGVVDEDDDDDDGYARAQSSSEAGFDEWGRFDSSPSSSSAAVGRSEACFFNDEQMARRLAGYLRPEPNLARQHVQAVVESKSSKKAASSGWRWGRGSQKQTSSSPSPSPVSPSGSTFGSGAEMDERVSMIVRAEEVTFRKENEFGVWESLSGFGIVVTVKVRRTG
ncbi:hypothetical protein B0T22DRAFT_169967 [Podospora appendiculata]|uniref:Uncharacterized protein n=1 Tax=Podospora appendiculata TaxID=314037 RepID=A0AAE0XB20_9PEZI|nr:hypothetical protein B0T22DRAFT_169967 [Podospora appendiculata]